MGDTGQDEGEDTRVTGSDADAGTDSDGGDE